MSNLLSNFGSIASMAGVFISIGGFILTLVNVKKSETAALESKKAAKAAEKASLQAVEDAKVSAKRVFNLVMLHEFERVLTLVEELIDMPPELLFNLEIKRYAYIKKFLLKIKTTLFPIKGEENEKKIRSFICFLGKQESEQIKRSGLIQNLNEEEKINKMHEEKIKLCTKLNKHQTDMHEIIATLQAKIGDEL